MPDKEIDVSVGGTEEAIVKVQALQAAISRTKEEAIQLANVLKAGGGDDGTRGQLGTSLRNLAGLQGALSAVTASAAPGGVGATGIAGIAAAGTAAAAFGGVRYARADISQVLNAAKGIGIEPYAAAQAFNDIRNPTGIAMSIGTPSIASVIQSALQTNPYNQFSGASAVGPSSALGGIAANAYYASQNPYNAFAGASPIGAASAIGTPGVGMMQYQWQQQQNLQKGNWGFTTGASGPSSLIANRFAGADPMGPSSPLGSPGVGMMQWQYQQQQTRAAGMNAFRNSAIYAGAAFGGQALGLYASQTASGEYDPMAAAGVYGSLIGGVLGGATGAVLGSLQPVPTPGLGAAVGLSAGLQLGPAIGQAIAAPYMNARNVRQTVASLAARQGVDPDMIARPGVAPEGMAISELAHNISMSGKSPGERLAISAGLYFGTDIISGPQFARTYAALGSGLLASGQDSRGALGMATSLATSYGMVAPAIAGMAAPVLGARSRMGGNSADLLLQFGPEAYGAYSDATGGSDITPRQLRRFGDVQTSQYRVAVAATRATGSGRAQMEALRGEMGAIGDLPDGTGSLAYSEARQQMRGARSEMWMQTDIMQYGLRATQISGALQRAQYLPFMPSNIMGLSLQQFYNNRGEIGRLQGRLGLHDISEQERQGITSQIESLRVSNAQTIGMLSEGMENRLPAMVAGRPAFFSRMNSFQLAAMRLHRAGSPARFAGAINGGQLAEQDDFVRGSEALVRPYSRTAGMNTTEPYLERIARAVEKMADGGGGHQTSRRPSEVNGQVNGMLATKAIDRQALFNTRN